MKPRTGKSDRAKLRKMSGAALKVVRRDFARARKDLDDIERLVAHATLASGAMAARVASGMFAGIADTLARMNAGRKR